MKLFNSICICNGSKISVNINWFISFVKCLHENENDELIEPNFYNYIGLDKLEKNYLWKTL